MLPRGPLELRSMTEEERRSASSISAFAKQASAKETDWIRDKLRPV